MAITPPSSACTNRESNGEEQSHRSCVDRLRLRWAGVDLPLDGDVGVAAGSETLRSTGEPDIDERGTITFKGGQGVATLVEFKDPIDVWSIVPFGQSHRPGSEHRTDQMRLYSENRMRPAWHDWSSLKDHLESTQELLYTPTRRRSAKP